MLYKAYRWLIFKIGDTRLLKKFSYITWDNSTSEVDGFELHKMVSLLEAGDVIISRHEGYVDNWGIGGAMIHGAIYVGDGACVEAVSEGVQRNSAYDTLRADKVIILRPRLSDKIKMEIIARALSIVGFDYDPLFDFNTEEEKEKILDNREKAKETVRFCCTEVPFYAYNGWAKHLNIVRKFNPSKMARLLKWIGLQVGDRIIKADDYIEADFDIVYCSKKADLEWFMSKGSSNNVLHKISKYWHRELDK